MNMVVGGEMSAMPNCHGMDLEQPALCHAHAQDQIGKQSVEQPHLPQVAAFLPAALVQDISTLFALLAKPSTAAAPSSSSHANAPPISILHCCFRI